MIILTVDAILLLGLLSAATRSVASLNLSTHEGFVAQRDMPRMEKVGGKNVETNVRPVTTIMKLLSDPAVSERIVELKKNNERNHRHQRPKEWQVSSCMATGVHDV